MPGLPGDDQFFIRRNHPDLRAATVGADSRFTLGLLVQHWIERDAELGQVGTDRGADVRAVLANSAGEDDYVGSAQFHQEPAQVAADFRGKYVQREPSACL